jgi:hypothetical protein
MTFHVFEDIDDWFETLDVNISLGQQQGTKNI